MLDAQRKSKEKRCNNGAKTHSWCGAALVVFILLWMIPAPFVQPLASERDFAVRKSIAPLGMSVEKKYEHGMMQAREGFSDCMVCPEMVILVPGKLLMGSWRRRSTRPPHEITISNPLAIGRYSVTFEEWDACVADGACEGYLPDDMGWGRGRRPVINVSLQDVENYVDWLSHKTGEIYRLPSEAEWEYAARGQNNAHVRDHTGKDRANCTGCSSVSKTWQTVEVGSFHPNASGLYDMAGNVWQWTQDCWHKNYKKAPVDGSAWRGRKCELRVLRGGGWSSWPPLLDPTFRHRIAPNFRGNHLGFRVVRKLSQSKTMR